MTLKPKTAIIIGAGPAGLTAAFELLERTDITPIIFEATDQIGGISQTAVHNGNRIDIGGHRFFSKSDRVLEWWLKILPLEKTVRGLQLDYQGAKATIDWSGYVPGDEEDVMLIRERQSRIYFNGKFFDYPLSLSVGTLLKLGPIRVTRIGLSYMWKTVTPDREENNLEDFFINRFGRELYETFFKSYTEKVWGKKCTDISAEWGRQRVKGLSLRKAIADALKRPFRSKKDVRQKELETSLIQQFMYPSYGPGHMWEKVAERIQETGGELHMNTLVERVIVEDGKAIGVVVKDQDGSTRELQADIVFSTMPVRQLVAGLTSVPHTVSTIAEGLEYRDFMVVGALLQKEQIGKALQQKGELITDNWLYIQEPHVHVGRIQIFNNWSPFLVADPNTAWVGLEYFASVGDELWSMSDTEIQNLAAQELQELGFSTDTPSDTVLIRMPKAYPAYTGTYSQFADVREYLDSIKGLYLIGRNGMHKYNNQDHSMLTAMTAVDLIAAGDVSKNQIWEVNTEQEYHEGSN